MPRAEHWSQVKIGIIALCGVIAAVTWVVFFARIGALHGDTTRLYMVTDMATRVMDGTEVRLAGQKAGLVRSVALRPPSADTSERILITMDVLNQYLPFIRRNSHVQIQPSGRLIGNPVIYITLGSKTAAAIQEGDTLRARSQIEARSAIAAASSLADSALEIAGSFTQIKSDFDTTRRDIASLRQVSVRQAEEVRSALSNFTDRALASRGTIASLVRDSAALRSQAQHLSAIADSIDVAANSRSGEFGRFRRDSSLIAVAHRTLASIAELRNGVTRYAGVSPGGATLRHQLDIANAKLDSLVQDAKRRPFRYLPF
ncbi:MAG: MlaD family protein [Gemmatimonadaceae bacterium]